MKPIDSLINQHLNGYYIEALLGHGGMARVYRAIDVHLQRYVALKVIDSQYRNDPQMISRFEREARVIAQLGQHPNIMRVYHYGEDQSYLYIAMEYIEGADLGAILRSFQQENEFMPAEEILNVARDICAALDYVHGNEVIHRDLKPSNIMLDRRGRAILTDFGIALFTPTGTLGEVFGSPHYIAPEQAVNSAQARPQSDIYALGVVLFELFTGRLPFEAENPMELAMMHMSQPPPAPRSLRPDLNPAVEAVILKALEKQPEDRYQTGRALYEDLYRAVRAVWGAAGPPPTLARLTMAEQVRRKSQPLPPPTLPPQAASTAALPPPASPPPPTLVDAGPRPPAIEPLVIPVETWNKKPAGKRRCGSIAATIVALALLCGVGAAGIYALRGFNLAALPGRTQAATSPSPLATATPALTEPPAATQPPTPAETHPATPEAPPTISLPPNAAYELLLVKFSNDFMTVVNNGDENLPLGPLQLGTSRAAIPGEAWGVYDLEPGDCVVAVRWQRRPRLPAETGCRILALLEGSPNASLWNRDFDVLYNNELVGVCREEEDTCILQIPIR